MVHTSKTTWTAITEGEEINQMTQSETLPYLADLQGPKYGIWAWCAINLGGFGEGKYQVIEITNKGMYKHF